MIPAALRPFLAALLTLPLRSLAGWLTARGIEVTGTQVSGAVEATLVWGLPLVSTLGVVGRRLLDKWINPANTASSHLAVDGKIVADAVKSAEHSAKLNALATTGDDPKERRWFNPPADPPHDED